MCYTLYVSMLQLTATRDDLIRIYMERDSLRDRLHDAERELRSQHEGIHELETCLQEQKAALSYLAVTKSQQPVRAPAVCTPVVSKPTFILKVTDVPKGVVPPTTVKASKGKAPTCLTYHGL
jgi:hypothetical protein